MANRKSKGKNNGRNASPSAVPKSSAISISEEDAALLEKAKHASKAGELDLAEYRRLLEEDLEKEIAVLKEDDELLYKAFQISSAVLPGYILPEIYSLVLS